MNAPESAEHFVELNRFLLKHLSNPLPSEASIPAEASKIKVPKSAGF
jgi:hypothetical protein